MSKNYMISKVYKPKKLDFGHRLTSMTLLPHERAFGRIYEGLCYDGGDYENKSFWPRHVVISEEDFQEDWVEVDEPDEIPEGRF